MEEQTSREADRSAKPETTLTGTEVLVLNPLYRMRNEKEAVVVHGWGGDGVYRLHHTAAIILALCDGRRTLDEIAQTVAPFAAQATGAAALAEATRRVREAATYFRKTRAEQSGGEQGPLDYPSAAALVSPALLPDFKRVPRPVYHAQEFLPQQAPARHQDSCYLLRDRAPTILQWHLTSACATNCRYCYLGRRGVAPMPKERLFSLFQEAHEIGVFEINLGGGDVLLYPDLIEVLEVLQEHAFLPVRLATKARVTREMARQLAEVGNVWELQFSIDSTVEDVADFMVRKTGFCRWIMESITNALEAGLSVSAKAVVTPYNIVTLPKFYRDLRRLGVQPVRMASYCRSGFHHSDDLYNTQESFTWLQDQLAALREEFPGDWVNVQNGAPEAKALDVETRKALWAKRSRCTAGRNMMMVCSDGKVIPCEQMPENDEIFVGDLMKQSLQEVWDGDALKTLTVNPPRDKFAGTVCYDCEEREQCHRIMGYCVRDACVYQGSPFVPPANCPRVEAPFVRRF